MECLLCCNFCRASPSTVWGSVLVILLLLSVIVVTRSPTLHTSSDPDRVYPLHAPQRVAITKPWVPPFTSGGRCMTRSDNVDRLSGNAYFSGGAVDTLMIATVILYSKLVLFLKMTASSRTCIKKRKE